MANDLLAWGTATTRALHIAFTAAAHPRHVQSLRVLRRCAGTQRPTPPARVLPVHTLMATSVCATCHVHVPQGQCDIFGSYKQNDGSDALMMVMHFQLKPLEVWKGFGKLAGLLVRLATVGQLL